LEPVRLEPLKPLLVLICAALLSAPTSAQSGTTGDGKVCVTLAGGVARGFAFLGVLEGLVEAGVPVDCIVGTSAGALVGGLYASGYSFETLRQRLPELQARQAELVRVLSPPLNGLLDPSGFEVVYRALVGGAKLEDTSPRLYVMATPLSRDAPSAPLADGDLASAMRASISIPLLFPTAQLNGAYYTDGGLRDPFPVGVARRLGATAVISIRAQPEPDLLPNNPIGTLSALTNTLVASQDQAQPDVWIRVKTFDALYFDFSRVRELMQRGREAAQAALPEVRRALEARGIALRAGGDPHADNAVNNDWNARLERGLAAARALPVPFTVAPLLDLAPVNFESGTSPVARAQYSSLGVGLEVGGGVLGGFSIAAGYANDLDSPNDGIYGRVSFTSGAWRASALYDPTRLPVGRPWLVEGRADVGVFTARATLDNASFGVEGALRVGIGAVTLLPRAEVRVFGGGARFEVSLGARLDLEPFVLRARVLGGLSSGNADGFSLGYNSLLRAYPLHAVVTSVAVIVNVEAGYRFSIGNLAGLLSAAPELRIFADFGVPIARTLETPALLWNIGAGVYVPGRWFGFLPFSVGLDAAVGPPGVRVLFYTVLPLP
jgi:NTE family protein